MHQALLGRFLANSFEFDDVDLRFIRSLSASLPSRLMAELEGTFSESDDAYVPKQHDDPTDVVGDMSAGRGAVDRSSKAS